MDSLRIRKLTLGQYKSVEKCEIELSPITLLVGRNGVGKSNILDSLRFVAESLRETLEYAIRHRGGIEQVRRRQASERKSNGDGKTKTRGGRPTHPSIQIEMTLANGATAKYGFKIAAKEGRSFSVDAEHCEIQHLDGTLHKFHVEKSSVKEFIVPSAKNSPPAAQDRLYLVAASGFPEFRSVYDLLTRMTFHNLNPEAMKEPQRPEPGELLSHDGRNLPSVIKHLTATTDSGALSRVLQYLNAIGIPYKSIRHKQAGAFETIEAVQQFQTKATTKISTFDAISLSDGTIRALGILVSLFSAQQDTKRGASLIGIEEPETALHPAAAGALMEALLEGSRSTQLIITSHSPDLLDYPGVTPEMIRPVVLEEGKTVAGILSPNKRQLLEKHLTTAGHLLRLDQLEPDPEDVARQREARGTLFANQN